MRRRCLAAVGCTLLLTASCSRTPSAREYPLVGQVVALAPARLEVTIRHEDIRGFMPGMTMPFAVKDARLLAGLEPGDLVRAKLVVVETEAFLSNLEKTGTAPLPPAAAGAPPPGLGPGDALPDAAFVDQKGARLELASLRGHRIVLTFVYTRCPLPEFCPAIDARFAALQARLLESAGLRDVRLLSVSVDPEYDRPPVLLAHARAKGADPAVWTFLTGDRDAIDRFGHHFGVSVVRGPGGPDDLVHNLRTIVVGSNGQITAVRLGSSWTVADVLADLGAAPRGAGAPTTPR